MFGLGLHKFLINQNLNIHSIKHTQIIYGSYNNKIILNYNYVLLLLKKYIYYIESSNNILFILYGLDPKLINLFKLIFKNNKNILYKDTKWKAGQLTNKLIIKPELIIIFNGEHNDLLIKEALILNIPYILFNDLDHIPLNINNIEIFSLILNIIKNVKKSHGK